MASVTFMPAMTGGSDSSLSLLDMGRCAICVETKSLELWILEHFGGLFFCLYGQKEYIIFLPVCLKIFHRFH